MLASFSKRAVKSQLFLVISLLGFIALWFSPVVVSIATALLILLAISNYKAIQLLSFKWLVISLFLILGLYVLDLARPFGSSVSADKLLLFVGLVGVQLGAFSLLEISRVKLIHFLLLIGIVVLLVNIYAIGHYLHHKDYYDAMLLQSKSIPIPGFRHFFFKGSHSIDACVKGGMHHIHFGVVNAIVLLALVGVLWNRGVQGVFRWVAFICAVGVFISFHILSSRTGIVSLYLGTIFTLIILAIKRGSILLLLRGASLVLIFLLGAYFFSASFHNKVINSVEDIQSWGGDTDINYKSMAMRMEAYKSSWYILKGNPLGVGAADQANKMQAAYTERNSVLFPQNRVGPHNQILEYGVKFGWVGVILLGFYLFQLVSLSTETNFVFWAILLTLIISLQFESLFERQASIYFISILLPLCYHLFVTKQINGELNDEKTL